MKVVWSEEAAWALAALEVRVARRHSADHPQLGRIVPEYGEWQLRELVDRWNRVLYRLRADAIEIVTIAPAWMPLDERDADDD